MAHVHVCAQRSQLLVVLLELAEAPLAIRVFFCGTSSQVGFRRQTPSLPLKTSFRPSSGLDFNPHCHKLLEYFSAYILILFCLFSSLLKPVMANRCPLLSTGVFSHQRKVCRQVDSERTVKAPGFAF